MSRRKMRKSLVRGERLTVEACLDCGIEILSPWDSARLLAKPRAPKEVKH